MLFYKGLFLLKKTENKKMCHAEIRSIKSKRHGQEITWFSAWITQRLDQGLPRLIASHSEWPISAFTMRRFTRYKKVQQHLTHLESMPTLSTVLGRPRSFLCVNREGIRPKPLIAFHDTSAYSSPQNRKPIRITYLGFVSSDPIHSCSKFAPNSVPLHGGRMRPPRQ